ncbi:LCP family protein [Streptomyces sp. NPDC050560]|uniref:LCP family protein n=1 Tax=Streptomyces sp. NPDC050560 TaxID=3365630 RepID=UPI003792D730
MDAQGRGRGDEVDPADQWVLNPETGEYELRLDPPGGRPTPPGPRGPRPPRGARPPQGAQGRTGPPRPRTGEGPPPGARRAHGSPSAPPGEDETAAPPRVPGQRRRRVSEPPPPSRRRGKQKKSRGKRILLWGSGGVAFVVVVAAVGGYLYYQHLNNNIDTTDVAGAGSQGFNKDSAFNVLLIGTDKRTGKGNEGYGDAGSVGHADTNILLHVAKDRSNATAMSIPRDLVTSIPDCKTKQKDGSEKIIPGTPHTDAAPSEPRFNTSLGQDGRDPGCTMRTVEAMTGIHVDHFMMADFNAVKTLTTAVGGVDICVGKPIDDPKSHLHLPKGTSTIKGEQALAFVRTRHSFGNEGDLDRIKVQQQFLSALVRKMKSNDTLFSPGKMLDLAEAATKALTVDTGIGSINKLKDVALEIKKVNPKNITFTTLPVVDNPAEGNNRVTVVMNKTEADPVLSMIKNDVSLTDAKEKESAEKDKENARLKGSKSDPADVRVDIYNGGADAGAAQQTLAWLQNNHGMGKASQLGNADATLDKTTLEYSPDQADQARELADVMGLPGSAMKPGKSETNDQGLPAMILTLGKDFKGAGVPIVPPKKAPKDIQRVSGDKKVCST